MAAELSESIWRAFCAVRDSAHPSPLGDWQFGDAAASALEVSTDQIDERGGSNVIRSAAKATSSARSDSLGGE